MLNGKRVAGLLCASGVLLTSAVSVTTVNAAEKTPSEGSSSSSSSTSHEKKSSTKSSKKSSSSSLVKKNKLSGRLIWSEWDSKGNCPLDSQYVYYNGVKKTDPDKGNRDLVYKSDPKTTPDHQGLMVYHQYWEGYSTYKEYNGCDASGKGYTLHIPEQMQVRVDRAYVYKGGGGGTAWVAKGDWKNGNLCAQYQKATFDDRSKKKCTNYASWVMANG